MLRPATTRGRGGNRPPHRLQRRGLLGNGCRTPAVAVIHENRGLTDWMRSVANQLAAAGYLAIAPDLLPDFDAGPPAHERLYPCGCGARCALSDGSRESTSDLQAVQSSIVNVPASNGAVAMVGFC